MSLFQNTHFATRSKEIEIVLVIVIVRVSIQSCRDHLFQACFSLQTRKTSHLVINNKREQDLLSKEE